MADDVKHSGTDRRYFVLGQTDDNRPLFVAFTLLANKNDVPYHSLLKVFLSERIESELQKHAPQKIKS